VFDLRKDGRILYISSVDISRGNGPGVNEREFTLEFCKTFGERAHILVPKPEIRLTEINQHNFTFSRNHKRHRPIPFLQHQLSQLWLANALMKSGRFDFLIFRLSILPFAQSYIIRHYRIPCAIKTLGKGVGDVLRRQGGVVGKALAPLNDVLVKDIITRAIAIDVCTEKYLTYVQERWALDAAKLCLIENATNTDRFYPLDEITARSKCNLSHFDPIVGFVGGRPWERGGTQMIELASRLLPQYPNLGIVIVGGGWHQLRGLDQLRKQAHELGVADHCVLPGQVPYERVPYFINAFDVGISLDKTETLSSVGNSSQKLRQYLACGKPVVSGPGGNLFLEREELGSIVNPDDINQITRAVTAWLSLTDDEKRAHCHRAVDFAQKHLSVKKTLDDRIEFWNNRLKVEQTGVLYMQKS
jgi:glycosyltransferase involved in cell wall biosynthesis